MIHTLKVILGGLVLLVLCVGIGRWLGGPTTGIATGLKLFLPLWLVGAGFNMWFGVTRAGYGVREELPFFAIVFAVPAAVGALVWWLVGRQP